MEEECVDERARAVPRSGMDDHVGPLVDYNHMVVFIHDVQRNVLTSAKQRKRSVKMLVEEAGLRREWMEEGWLQQR